MKTFRIICPCDSDIVRVIKVDTKVIVKSETLILFMPALVIVWIRVRPTADLHFAGIPLSFGQEQIGTLWNEISDVFG